MADFVRVPEADWQDICDSVREKTGGANGLLSSEVAPAVRGIQSGGGVDLINYITTLGNAFNSGAGVGMPSVVNINAFNTTNFSSLFWNNTQEIDTVNLTTKVGTINLQAAFQGVKISTVKIRDVEGGNVVRFAQDDKAWDIGKNGAIKVFDCIFDMTNTTTGNSFVGMASLEEIRFVENTCNHNITFGGSSLLSTDSLMSIANLLDGSATGKTLTLHATAKEKCTAIMGNNSDGTFALDDAGTMTLTEFITTVKGWTIA